ncbi:hypothetical protein K435DRAFT_974075 [Dendrothele bispora CBS 962.96]|uniref:Uncharacterized protein n=1 Tax=Dendrothele bispora (strain CBS 962.96) TaxID=1314807 RepID=A0A4S8KNK5_DENBC|nr:hypothetical protein K435DRAFT_974075 [Dendrothele bispora CBS 962.96]
MAQPDTANENGNGPFRSIFHSALARYLQQLNDKKSKRTSFITSCLDPANSHQTPQDILRLVEEIENKSTKRRKTISKIMVPVVRALESFNGVISSLADADPLPSAVIWAALGLIVKGALRYIDVFDKIRNHLGSLKHQLECLQEYEDLYGDSENMRNLLCDSYMSILKFWNIVEKQCQESVIKGTLKQTFSLDTKKLDNVIEELTDNTEGLARLADIVDARRDQNMREDTRKEWEEAKLERIEARRERQEASKFRDEQRQEQQDDQYRKLCVWLGCQEANGYNIMRHEANIAGRVGQTCQWLDGNNVYGAWKKGETNVDVTRPSPILWINGPPGSGKTFLCSHAIQDIQKSYPNAAIVYHFFQFDRSNDAVVTLKILADKLFQIYWDRQHCISKDLYAKTQSNSFATDNIREVIQMLVKSSDFQDVFFFLDGLDEELGSVDDLNPESRWRGVQTVVDVVADLVKGGEGKVRLWCSSQQHHLINELLVRHSTSVIDIKHETKEDVQFYLVQELMSELRKLEIPQREASEMFFQLTENADEEANFLWAKFMVSDLRESADDLDKFKEFIKRAHPSGMERHYTKILERIDPRHRQLACEVFALVAFARRPLHIREIREAIGILRNANNLESSMPFTKKLEAIFSPLIEVLKSPESDNPDDYTCHLFHSTVKTFFVNHPEILKIPQGNMLYLSPCTLISPSAIASACLRYLSQPRYSTLLRKGADGEWCDASGGRVQQHRFLIYSAKYWDKHLDNIHTLDHASELKKAVRKFITSSNFQTCIQVQNLWVDHQFGIFGVSNIHNKLFLRRVLPEWFTEEEEFVALLRNFRLYLREWRTLLNCTRCENPGCVLHPYAGLVDRCWWTALGRSNFLSKMHGRYVSFTFETEDSVSRLPGTGYLCEGMCTAGNTLKILYLESHDRDAKTLKFVCQFWTIDGTSAPVFVKQQTILTDEMSTNWQMYTSTIDGGPARATNIGAAAPASFSQDCSSLRLGAQIYVLDQSGNYCPVQIPTSSDLKIRLPPDYFEEWAFRGDYVVFATRRKIATTKGGRTETGGPKSGVDSEEKERDLNDDSDEEEFSEFSSSEELDDRAYETWSECSSEHSDDIFEDDLITPWTGPQSDIDSGAEESCSAGSDDDGCDGDSFSNDSDTSDTSPKDPSHKETDKQKGEFDAESDTESEASYLPASAVVGYSHLHNDDDDDDDFLWDQDPSSLIGYDNDSLWDQEFDAEYDDSFYDCLLDDWDVSPGHQPAVPKDAIHGTITVLDIKSKDKLRIFRFSQPLRYVLYDSPPVLHPTGSLLVWPLHCGDILFSDFLANTYFIRRLRPSTTHTRHIFMKCRFSPCGQYLHVVSLEGRRPPNPPKKKHNQEDSLKLALMVSTYHLCQRQTSRCPPTLIHRTRVALGSVPSLRVSYLPYTVTWNPTQLYFTFAGDYSQLRVYRINLFNPNKGDYDGINPSVLVPREMILLPDTAQKRKVYFFPSQSNSSNRILIGSEVEALVRNENTQDDREIKIYLGENFGVEGRILSPPIGCYVTNADLGEWVETTDQSKLPEDLGIGQFNRHLREQFNPEDDCDLEPLLF